MEVAYYYTTEQRYEWFLEYCSYGTCIKISEKYVLTPVRRSETDGDATGGDVGCIVMG